MDLVCPRPSTTEPAVMKEAEAEDLIRFVLGGPICSEDGGMIMIVILVYECFVHGGFIGNTEQGGLLSSAYNYCIVGSLVYLYVCIYIQIH